MKVTAILFTLMAATAVSASALDKRDAGGAGYDPAQRRTNSPCAVSNGDTSAAATEPVLYVDISWLKYQIMFANVYFCEKVECKNGSLRRRTTRSLDAQKYIISHGKLGSVET
ncbi:hypothetical protein N7501_006231 [Penicillium viridicatum]|nr:hypothetical protein N7501_006231 [Penicillium viridicatum]